MSIELNPFGDRSVAFVEVFTAIVEPEHIGDGKAEAEKIVDYTVHEEELIVNPVGDE